MRQNVVYLCKNKLIGIDWTLPFLMEIKKRFPYAHIVIVFLNKAQLNLIRKNYNIWECICAIDAEVYVLRSKSKAVTLFRMLKLVARLSFSRNIIIKNADILPLHKFTMGILKRMSRVTQIKAYAVSKALESYGRLNTQLTLSNERSGKEKKLDFFVGDFDYFLSQLDASQFKLYFDIKAPTHKMVRVGFPYRSLAWQKYVEEAASRNPIINDGPYFLFILTCLGKRVKYFDEPEIMSLLEETLTVLKKYNDKIRTILRPHAITDVKRVEYALRELEYENYSIDYGHPMVLSYKASFILGNLFSDAMFHGYYLGKPVVEYFQYDSELFKRMSNQSYGGRCCDFYISRDKEELDKTVRGLLDGTIQVCRDPHFIDENFPETPKQFYDLWENVLR